MRQLLAGFSVHFTSEGLQLWGQYCPDLLTVGGTSTKFIGEATTVECESDD